MLRFISKLMAPDRYHPIVSALNNLPGLRGLGISASVVAVVVFAVANIVADIVPSPADVPWEHLTLEGALIAAVVVLWRALAVKDAQLVKSAEATTAALSASAASNAELRKIIEHLNESLTEARR